MTIQIKIKISVFIIWGLPFGVLIRNLSKEYKPSWGERFSYAADKIRCAFMLYEIKYRGHNGKLIASIDNYNYKKQ